MSKTIRTHLEKEHTLEWNKIVVLEKLKGWEDVLRGSEHACADKSGEDDEATFTHNGFLDRLVRWVTADDEV